MDFRNNGDDPARRWLDPEAFAGRDREIWRRRQDGHTIRDIAAALGMGIASVHRALERLARHQRQSSPEQELERELDAVLAKYDDGGLQAEDVRIPEDVERLNELERYTLRFFDPDSPQRRALADWVASHPQPPPEPTVFPAGDGSWTAGVDAALAGDTGTDNDW